MGLHIIWTSDDRLVSSSVVGALRDGIEALGSATLLVPSIPQALEVQRALTREQGLAMAVATTTPAAYVRDRWEVWGDGRAFADGVTSCVVARETIVAATDEERGPIRLSEGMVSVLSQLANQALPWLPLDADMSVRAAECAAAGLTTAETKFVGLAGSYAKRLEAHGYVAYSQASAAIPHLLLEAGADVPAIVCAGFTSLARTERELLRALASLTSVTLVVQKVEGPASEEVEGLVAWFADGPDASIDIDDRAPALEQSPCDHRLEELRQALFGDEPLEVDAAGPVELLLPSGHVAEAEIVARCVERLAIGETSDAPSDRRVIIATPDVTRTRRELVPKLAERGISVRLLNRRALAECPSALGFFAFARTVARLVDLANGWPAPKEGLEGPVAQLGDMSWWPPRDLTDFLLSGIAHMDAEAAWKLDASWRGNRLLTPARLLEMLQSERLTSAPVARATTELVRGRLGSAASRLLAPYLSSGAKVVDDERADEERAVLQAIVALARSLHDLGLTANPADPEAITVSQLVQTAEWAAIGMGIVSRQVISRSRDHASIELMSTREASRQAKGSATALVLLGLTTTESPISSSDDLLGAVLEHLGIEPKANPMAKARAEFHALMAVPRERLVLERVLYDADSKVTYPSVMLSELLAAYGIGVSEDPGDHGLPVTFLGETELGQNLAPDGVTPRPRYSDSPARAGELSASARPLVFVPQDGSDALPGGKPILSASQIETYLDCPYKWFSLRRLRLGTVDAGHTGMEMGTFAHRVLEVTYRELLARALEAENPGIPREELLAAIELDPARHVAGSRVDHSAIEAAQATLDLEFDLHQQHMYMVKQPRVHQQLLVAHDSAERAQEDQLRQDLLSAVAYQTKILEGFEPRLFEWSFGRHGELVEYAGAFFTGTVDRIDVNPHGDAVIIDYKHKNPTGFAAEYDALQDGVLEGTVLPRRVQSLIYAQVVRRAFEGRLNLVGSVYLSTKSPHALAGAADQNVADLVFGRLSSVREQRVCVPLASDGSSGMTALLDQTEALAADQVAQMLEGKVEARPRDRHSCDFCPVMQCERRVAR